MGFTGPLSKERALRRLKETYIKGSNNPELNLMMTQSEWMLRTGHSSEDFYELPRADVEQLIAHKVYSRAEFVELISIGVAKGIGIAFSKKKKQEGGN